MMTRRESDLEEILKHHGRIAVALSGGVDSSVLLGFAANVLGSDHCIAFTIQSPYMMEEEVEDARELCSHLHVRHRVLEVGIPEDIATNPPDRCYLCKKRLFNVLREEASREGFRYLADGTNADDSPEDRPGMRALVEAGIASPLREARIGKADIRELGRKLGIQAKITEKPAYSCLLTRLEHNRPVQETLLTNVDRAEQFLRDAGFLSCRVRVHGTLARIELSRDSWPAFFTRDMPPAVFERFSQLGFAFITLDLRDYTMGNMTPPTPPSTP